LTACIDAAAWLTLEAIPGLGPDAAQRLLRAFDLPADILAAPPAQLEPLVGKTLARAIAQGVDAAVLQPGLDWLAQPDNHLITWNDPAYPAALRDLPAPPAWLYVKGDPA